MAKPRLPVERLDTSRPHGVVYGETAHNIAFTQRALGIENWPYAAQGKLIEEALTKEQRDVLAAKREKLAPAVSVPKAPVPAAAPLDDCDPLNLEIEDDPDLEDGEDDGEDRPAPPPEDEINLVMWLKGEVDYMPHEIAKAMKVRYGVNKPQRRNAAMYLVEEQKLLPRAQVSPKLLPPLPASEDE